MGRDGMPTPAGTLVDGQQHGSPLRDDVLHIDELRLGQARSAAYQMMREAGPVVRDAQGAYVVTDAESASYVLRLPSCSLSTSWRPARARRRTGQRPWSASITCTLYSGRLPSPARESTTVKRSEQAMTVVARCSSGPGRAARRPGPGRLSASRRAALWLHRPGPPARVQSGRSWLRYTWFPSRPWLRYGCSPRASPR